VQGLVDMIKNIDLPDIPGLGRITSAIPGVSGRTLAAAPSSASSDAPTINIESIDVSGVIGEADAGALLTSIIDRYLRSQGRAAVFGT